MGNQVLAYNYTLNLADTIVTIAIIVLIVLVHTLFRNTMKKEKKETKYYIAKNRAQLMAEITLGLKIISNLKTLIFLNKLTDDYLDRSIKRLEKIVLCYDRHHGIVVLGKIHKSRNNKDMLKISLSLLELEFRKV